MRASSSSAATPLRLQREHEEAAAVNLVRKRPPPDLYLPPLPWHFTGHFSEVTDATGGSAVSPSFPVAGISHQARMQRDQDRQTLRLTGLGASMEAFDATGKPLSDFGDTLGMSYECIPMAYKTGNLDLENLGIGTRRRTDHWLHPGIRYKLNDQRETKDRLKCAPEKQDGGEKEISQRNPGSKTASIGFIKYSNTYSPGQERHEEETICDLDEKGEYELPKVCLEKENMENHKKMKKAVARLFTALKMTGIRNHTRYFLLLVLFCTLITAVDSSSRSEISQQGFCPKADAILFLLPAHEPVCPLLDISSVHWTHSKRIAPQQRETADECATAILIVSLFCCLGPWLSVNNLEPVQGKVHRFLFFMRLRPVRMWYCTLAMSINYYVSMIVYGVMSKSDQSCGIWVPNAIYCSIFLLLVAYLCYREKTVFQVDNMVLVVTCFCCIIVVGSIGALHWLCVLLRPKHFEQIFYFEKIALFWSLIMFVFRIFTLEHNALNVFFNILSALIPMSLLCTDVHSWHRAIVITSSVARILECVIWGIWWRLGRNPLIVIEHVNP